MNDSYKLHKILPTKVDPLVSLMKVEKVPDSTYEVSVLENLAALQDVEERWQLFLFFADGWGFRETSERSEGSDRVACKTPGDF